MSIFFIDNSSLSIFWWWQIRVGRRHEAISRTTIPFLNVAFEQSIYEKRFWFVRSLLVLCGCHAPRKAVFWRPEMWLWSPAKRSPSSHSAITISGLVPVADVYYYKDILPRCSLSPSCARSTDIQLRACLPANWISKVITQDLLGFEHRNTVPVFIF